MPHHNCIPKHHPSFLTLEGLKNSVLICCGNQVKKTPNNQKKNPPKTKPPVLYMSNTNTAHTGSEDRILSVQWHRALTTEKTDCQWSLSFLLQFAQTPWLPHWQTSLRCSMETASHSSTTQTFFTHTFQQTFTSMYSPVDHNQNGFPEVVYHYLDAYIHPWCSQRHLRHN